MTNSIKSEPFPFLINQPHLSLRKLIYELSQGIGGIWASVCLLYWLLLEIKLLTYLTKYKDDYSCSEKIMKYFIHTGEYIIYMYRSRHSEAVEYSKL